MRKINLLLAVVATSISLPTFAEYVLPLEVNRTQIVDQATGDSSFSYTVDGVEIEVSEKEKRIAKNWNLSDSEWAKYKYIMEYTPRGLWTPDLDPPLVLGNLAKTDEERMRYVEIQSEIEIARMKGESLMTDATMQYALLNNPKTPKPVSAFKSKLPTNKDSLRSVFVDLNECEAECKTFVTLAIASTSSSTQLDLHFNGANESEAKRWLSTIGVDDAKIAQKQISISAQKNNPTYQKLKGSSTPFYINKTEEGVTRHD